MNNTVYTSKEKNYQISSKKPSATKHSPPSNVYDMEFYHNFLFEYSLIGIEQFKFIRKNEIWCRIWEIEDLSRNVRKKQDRTSLTRSFVWEQTKARSCVMAVITTCLRVVRVCCEHRSNFAVHLPTNVAHFIRGKHGHWAVKVFKLTTPIVTWVNHL